MALKINSYSKNIYSFWNMNSFKNPVGTNTTLKVKTKMDSEAVLNFKSWKRSKYFIYETFFNITL